MLAHRELEKKKKKTTHFLTSDLPMLKRSSCMTDFLGLHFLFRSDRDGTLLATSGTVGVPSQTSGTK